MNKYMKSHKDMIIEKQEDMERWQRYKATGNFIANEDVNTWLQNIGNSCELPCIKRDYLEQ